MITLKVNRDLLHGSKALKAGDTVKLAVDKEGNILDSFWARRLRDAAIDNCVEVVQEKTATKKESK